MPALRRARARSTNATEGRFSSSVNIPNLATSVVTGHPYRQETHLANVQRKLTVRNRVEIAAGASRTGIATG